jgi:hypothetical protein
MTSRPGFMRGIHNARELHEIIEKAREVHDGWRKGDAARLEGEVAERQAELQRIAGAK